MPLRRGHDVQPESLWKLFRIRCLFGYKTFDSGFSFLPPHPHLFDTQHSSTHTSFSHIICTHCTHESYTSRRTPLRYFLLGSTRDLFYTYHLNMSGFQIRYVSIPLCRKDRSDTYIQNLFDREADPFSISNQSPQLALNPKPRTEATSLIQTWILEWKTKRSCVLPVGLCSRQMFV